MADLTVFYKDSKPSDQYKLKTLCFLQRINAKGQYEYLLGKHYKQEKWNGFGGKVGDKTEFKNETIDEALVREGQEEFNIKVINPSKRGIILFNFIDANAQENKILCHLFFADHWNGEVTPSLEMLTPTWFSLESMPWNEMWPNDRLWLEEVLKRNDFLEAEFTFDHEQGLLASKSRMVWKPL